MGAGLPSIVNSGGVVLVVLPRLVDLKLHGTDEAIEQFIDLIGMSSPLHNITIDFEYKDSSLAARVNITKKFLTIYYGCERLEHLRKATNPTISSTLSHSGLIIGAKSRPTSPHPIYNLELQFRRITPVVVGRIIPLFPLNHVCEYSVE